MLFVPPTPTPKSWLAYAASSAATGLALALLAGLWWHPDPDSLLPLWLGWGLSLGLLFRGGLWAAPAVLLGLAGAAAGETWQVSAPLIVLLQLLALALPAWCLRRFPAFDPRLENLPSTVALAAMAAWSGLGAACLLSWALGSWSLEAFFTWTRSAALGILVGTPLILFWPWKKERPWSGRETFDNILWLVATIYFSHLVFNYWSPETGIDYPLKLVLFPVLIAAALRFGPPGVALGMLAVSLVCLLHFHDPEQDNSSPLSQVWTFVALLGFSSSVLAAIFTEMRRREERAAANEARLRTLVGALPDTLLVIGPDGLVEEAHVPAPGPSPTVSPAVPGKSLRDLFGEAASPAENLVASGGGILLLRLETPGLQRFLELRAARMAFGGATRTLLLVNDQTEIENTRRAVRTRDSLLAAGAAARHLLLTEPDESAALHLALAVLVREGGLTAALLRLPPTSHATRPTLVAAGEAAAAQELARLAETLDNQEPDASRFPPQTILLPLRARTSPEGWLIALPQPGSPCLAHPAILAEIAQGFAAYLENRRAEHDLRAARERADAANSAKGEFLAMMSHEIRTPLNAVIGYADLLTLTPLTDEQKDHVKIVNRSAGMLLELIGNILDYSKIESRSLDLAAVPFDLEELLLEALGLVSIKASEKGLRLRPDFPGGFPTRFLGDSARLRQILVNLLINAVKFTKTGEVVLSLQLADDPRPGHRRASFAVRDTGVGIPADKLHRLFKPFSQVDASTTREFGGTGLGLAIASRLVERMGGALAVESSPGQGSVFRFSLILTECPADPGRNTPNIFLLGRSAAAGLRLLFVDDDETNLSLGDKLLRELGARPDLARNGLEALDLLRSRPYDGVFLDLQMPKLDGLETTRRLRAGEAGETNRRTFVCAATAFVQPSDRDAARQAGMDDFLPKPIQRKQFLEVLARIRPQASE